MYKTFRCAIQIHLKQFKWKTIALKVKHKELAKVFVVCKRFLIGNEAYSSFFRKTPHPTACRQEVETGNLLAPHSQNVVIVPLQPYRLKVWICKRRARKYFANPLLPYKGIGSRALEELANHWLELGYIKVLMGHVFCWQGCERRKLKEKCLLKAIR